MRRALLAIPGLALLLSSCVPSYAVAPGDGGGASDASTDAPPDTTPPADGPAAPFNLVPVMLAPAGAAVMPTGAAQQLHAFYAAHDQRTWFFYIDDDTTKIKTLASKDRMTWSAGAPIDVTGGAGGTHGGYGNNFSVAYGDLGGADVVHLVVSERASTQAGSTHHIRATIANQTLTAAAPALVVSGGGCDIDGPSVVLGTDGHVYDGTGWYTDSSGTACDMDFYRSDSADTGAAGSFTGTFSNRVYFAVSGYSAAHQLVALGGGGLLAAWADHGGSPNDGASLYDQISFTQSMGATGAWVMPLVALFSTSASTGSQGANDWVMCRVSDAEVHAVRHFASSATTGASSGFEHVIWNGVSWQVGAAPAALTSPINGGLVVLGDGTPAHGIVAFALAVDGTIYASSYHAAALSWTAWRAISGAAARRALAGTGCGGPGGMIFWSEGSANSQTLYGGDVTALFQ